MTDIAAAKEQAQQAVNDIATDLVRISKDIHSHPELAWQEHRAYAALVPFLAEHGFAMQEHAYGMETAFRGDWGQGPTSIAICAEYDALPEIGHACGHNLIAGVGVGTAVAVTKVLDPKDARIVILGTPAEEGNGGKIPMVRKGCFDDIDVAMMAHPGPVDIADAPAFGVAHVDVEYRGKAVHASTFPEQGVNALDALVTAYQAIAQLRQHIRRDARLHGIISHGGDAANVVPEYTKGVFYVRALKPWYLEELKKRVQGCFEAGALATGCTMTVDWHAESEYAPLKNNPTMAGVYRRNAEELGRSFFNMKDVTTGSTDMGNVSQVVPSIHPSWGVGAPALNHSAEFTAVAATDAAHENMISVTKAMAMTAVELALDPDLLQRAKADFKGGR
jgi:amidohydrolase